MGRSHVEKCICRSKEMQLISQHVRFSGLNMMNKIKTILAVILISCTFLPLSRCENKKPIKEFLPQDQVEAGKNKSFSDVNQKDAEKKYSYLIPIKEVRIDEPSTLLWIVGFVWPLPFWFLKSRIYFKWKTLLFSLLEVLLIGISLYVIVLGAFYLGETVYGGYIALVCISGISAIYLYEVIVNVIKWKNKSNLALSADS
jgi:hypothetical protein